MSEDNDHDTENREYDGQIRLSEAGRPIADCFRCPEDVDDVPWYNMLLTEYPTEKENRSWAERTTYDHLLDVHEIRNPNIRVVGFVGG